MALKSGMAGLMIYLKAEFSCYKSVKPEKLSPSKIHMVRYTWERHSHSKSKNQKMMASHNKSCNLARQMPLDGLLVMMVLRQGQCSQDWPPASVPPTPTS